VIPSLLCCPGAAVSTSTKPDVLRATAGTRAQVGEVWVFDPTGAGEPEVGRRLSWSPVTASYSWDGALLMARAMAMVSPAAKGTTHEHHWTERSAALLAPLLHAAALEQRTISDVLRWVLRQDLDAAGRVLEHDQAEVANDVLVGIAQTDGRERSSIFSAAAGVLAAYNADGPRQVAEQPNFDPHAFVGSSDTIYITAPAHHQALAAPLVVGLLEEIRHATYERAAHPLGDGQQRLPVLFLLDEVANIAPVPDLPAWVSEGGGQGAHILCCLQDLSQARHRWGPGVAEGFLSLFQTKLVLRGIADPRTLEALSMALGEYDRQMVSRSHGLGRTGLLGPSTRTETVTYSTQRQRVLSPGEVAAIPPGHGLLLSPGHWGKARLAPWHTTPPWPTLTARPPAPRRAHPQVVLPKPQRRSGAPPAPGRRAIGGRGIRATAAI